MSVLKNNQLDELIRGILENRGVPRNIKACIEESLTIAQDMDSDNEKISCIISVLDDVSSDPNLSSYARTQIWNTVSTLESMKK